MVKEDTVLADDYFNFIDSFCNEYYEKYCDLLDVNCTENCEFVLRAYDDVKVFSEDDSVEIIWNNHRYYPIYLFNCGVLKDSFNLVLEYNS